MSDYNIEMLAAVAPFSDILKKFLQFSKRIETEDKFLNLRHCMLVNRFIKDATTCCGLKTLRESLERESVSEVAVEDE